MTWIPPFTWTSHEGWPPFPPCRRNHEVEAANTSISIKVLFLEFPGNSQRNYSLTLIECFVVSVIETVHYSERTEVFSILIFAPQQFSVQAVTQSNSLRVELHLQNKTSYKLHSNTFQHELKWDELWLGELFSALFRKVPAIPGELFSVFPHQYFEWENFLGLFRDSIICQG